jgi:hypothetical protein
MPGKAAMLLFFDVAPEAIAEHDDWHTHEHLPERLSIPGFLRGTRWVALREGQTRYFVTYEVHDLGILTSAPYLARLNSPTPWTAKMMPHYQGMRRGFCALTGSGGLGRGQAALAIRFKPRGDGTALRQWLVKEVLGKLPARPGLGGMQLFVSAMAPPMTSEQRIRGADAGVDWALVVTGYEPEALVAFECAELGKAQFESAGAVDFSAGLYRMHYALLEREAAAR